MHENEIISIESFLNKGALIKTHHVNNYDWVNTIVLDLFSDLLEIKLVDDYLVRVLMIGDEIECKYEAGTLLYKLNAVVYNVKLSTMSIILKVNNIKRYENKRSSKRYDVILISSILNPDSFTENYSIISNISMSGLKVVTKAELVCSQNVRVVMHLEYLNLVSALCEVKWLSSESNNKSYGLKILEMGDFEFFKYEGFIESLENHEKKLIEDTFKIL